ncbi:MAG TPA: 4Fe-4S binding protein [Syntrophales bacterium]|nr:4Fe-4S binding protein [Syntrophales bacterium]
MAEAKASVKNGRLLTMWRRLSQIGMLTILGQWSLYGIVRCPFPVPFVECATCPVISCWGRISTLFWGFWLLLPLSVLLFGRAFCGWICPGGLVNQLIGKLSFSKMRVRNTFNRVAPWGLLLGAAVTMVLLVVLNNPRWNIPVRTTGGFWESIALTFQHANISWLTRTFAVLFFVIAGLGISNLWCRYLCPTGGVLELLKRFSWFKIYKTGACNDCEKCLSVCEMGTRPDEVNCTNCGDCLKSCPVNAIKIGKMRY